MPALVLYETDPLLKNRGLERSKSLSATPQHENGILKFGKIYKLVPNFIYLVYVSDFLIRLLC